MVAETVVVEIKTVETLVPIHDAQWLTDLKRGGYPVGVLLNFKVPVLKDGMRRKVMGFKE